MRPLLFAVVIGLVTHAHAKPARGPLTPDERAVLQGARCAPFVQTLQDAAKQASGKPGPEGMLTLLAGLQRPATIAEADWRACAALFERDLRAYLGKAIEAEAVGTLAGLVTGFRIAFEVDGKFCPATKQAVPAALKVLSKGPYAAKPEEWSDPAWTCVGATPPATQRFQYAIVSNARKRTFEIVAKGYPGGDGTLVTLVRRGKVVGDKLEVGEVVRR